MAGIFDESEAAEFKTAVEESRKIDKEKMSGDYILDSNIVINIFRNDSATIKEESKLSKIYIPVIVLRELLYGANKSNQTSKRTLEIEQLKRRVTLLYLMDNTTKCYGESKKSYERLWNWILGDAQVFY